MLFDRIMSGEGVCEAEVRETNARMVDGWVQRTESHHDPEGCKVKNCVHRPGRMTVEWVQVIRDEAANSCTCGEHGIWDPEERDRVWRRFRDKWSADMPRPAVVRG